MIYQVFYEIVALISQKTSGLLNRLRTSFNSDAICLDTNIDGLPLCKSSKKQVWPILCGITNTQDTVYRCIRILHKTSECKYFFRRICFRIKSGVYFKNKHYKARVKTFIMDAPARSFVTGTKGHSGYYSCIRCTQKGDMHKNQRPRNRHGKTNYFRLHAGRLYRCNPNSVKCLDQKFTL